MGRYVLRRVLQMVPLMLGISAVIFAIIQAAPGGPEAALFESGRFVDPEVIEAYRAQRGENVTVFSVLTRREREVLQLLAEGQSTKDIAARLGLSLKTVGTHRGHVMEKLGIHSVAGLTKYAIREGLTTPEE